MKKLFVWILSAALCVSLTACAGKTTPAPADESAAVDAFDAVTEDAADAESAVTDAEAAYQAKIAELNPVNENEDVHWVVFPCGAGEKILVIAPSVYGDGETIEADVYQYADGEVKFIASVSSTGTAYPLAFTEDAILFGGNHTSGKLVINNGAGELYQVKDMNIEGKTPVLEIYDMVNGEGTLKSSEELSPEQAETMDYYINAFADETAEVIGFM